MTEHDPRLYLIHIVESADFVASYIEGKDGEAFAADQQLQDAVIRRIEIMGEAVKNLSSAVREAHPQVPWRLSIGYYLVGVLAELANPPLWLVGKHGWLLPGSKINLFPSTNLFLRHCRL